MSYFKGPRRRVRKRNNVSSETLSESKLITLKTTEEKTDLQTVDLRKDGQMQRKRLKTVDNSEMEQAKKPRKNKALSSSSKSHTASIGHTHTRKTKVTNKASDKIDPVSQSTTGRRRNKQIIRQADSLSSSESEGNLADEEDSVGVDDTEELFELSDSKFVQQQIKILKIPFQLEKDCPALSKIKANDSKHLSLQVIHNALRKVNHRTEDEILRSLNRLTQRKLLESLSATRRDSRTTSTSDEQSKRCKELQERVANLEKAYEEVKQEHAQYKCIGDFVSQLETDIERFDSKELAAEIQRTNKLLVSTSLENTSKDKEMNHNAGARPGAAAGDNNIPCSHEQLVQILFKD